MPKSAVEVNWNVATNLGDDNMPDECAVSTITLQVVKLSAPCRKGWAHHHIREDWG